MSTFYEHAAFIRYVSVRKSWSQSSLVEQQVTEIKTSVLQDRAWSTEQSGRLQLSYGECTHR